MSTLTQAEVKAVMKDVNIALAKVAAKHGFELPTQIGARFDESSIRVAKVEFQKLTDAGTNLTLVRDWEIFCDINPSVNKKLIDHNFRFSGELYKIVEISKRGRNRVGARKLSDSTLWKFGAEHLVTSKPTKVSK